VKSLTKVYKRYVDDTFVICESESKMNHLFKLMNCLSPSLKITKENMEENTLGFLDVKVSRADNKLVTSIYRKKTDTNLMMKYESNLPIKYKRNLVRNLTVRCLRICSSQEALSSDLKDLKNRLMNNGFPEQFLAKNMDFVIERNDNEPEIDKKPDSEEKKRKVFVKIPFLNSASSWLAFKLRSCLEEKVPSIDCRPVLLVKDKLKNFVCKPRSIPMSLHSDIVYKYTCSKCNMSYVGETYRHLHIRACEHVGISWRTGKTVKTPGNSSINEHIIATGHKGQLSNFRILHRNHTSNYIIRKILEAKYIKSLKPAINGNITGFQLQLKFPAW
jgi:hypothetical protein